MTNVQELIPQNLQAEVDSALAWFNAHENASFEVTGIVNPPTASNSGEDLRLVLCGEGVCRQETFRGCRFCRCADGCVVGPRSRARQPWRG